MSDRLTAQQAAELLGYHIDHVYRLLRSDELRGEQFNRVWIIPRSEVDKVLRLREEHGRFWADHREEHT